MKWVLIANPIAGHGRCAREVDAAHRLLRERGIAADLVLTGMPGDGVRQGRIAAEQGYRGIIVAGGEGTVNEVINGLASVADTREFTFATLPLGTSNSFLRDFSLRKVDDAVDRIASGLAAPCDLLECTLAVAGEPVRRLVLNNIIVGFGADVGDFMNRRLKFLGHRGYSLGVAVQVIRLRRPEMCIEVDGKPVSQCYTMINIGNSQYTGGTMRISPTSKVDDGLLEVLSVYRLSRVELLRAFPKIFTGDHLGHKKIRVEQGNSVAVTCEKPLPVLIDGDILGATPMQVTVLPNAIRFVR